MTETRSKCISLSDTTQAGITILLCAGREAQALSILLLFSSSSSALICIFPRVLATKKHSFPLFTPGEKTAKLYTTVSLTSHWLELSHTVTLTAKEDGKQFCVFFFF